MNRLETELEKEEYIKWAKKKPTAYLHSFIKNIERDFQKEDSDQRYVNHHLRIEILQDEIKCRLN